jgi:hypothetical protein
MTPSPLFQRRNLIIGCIRYGTVCLRSPCAEKLFMVLISQYRALIGPMVLQMLADAPEPNNMTNLLLRDSIYTAIGLGAYDLFDYFNFDEWVMQKLVNESQSQGQETSILRRRIAWVIGKWVVVKASKDLRPILYQILLTLLGREQDLVVRLTAITNLRVCLDDFDFEGTPFQQFLPLILDLTMQLIDDVDEFESKLKILSCIIVISERMEGHIVPFIGPILQVLPGLWNRSEGQSLFRTSIVTILTKLTISLRSESNQLHPIILPIMRESLDTTNV